MQHVEGVSPTACRMIRVRRMDRYLLRCPLAVAFLPLLSAAAFVSVLDLFPIIQQQYTDQSGLCV